MPSTGHLSRSLHKALRALHVANQPYATASAARVVDDGSYRPGIPHNAMLPPCNWHTFNTQVLSRDSLADLFGNRIPDVCVPGFLAPDECSSLVKIIKTHEIGSYNDKVFPPIGSVGTTQFDHQKDKAGYFASVDRAGALQHRFRTEAGIDVISRVQAHLSRVTELPVRLAQEGDKEYFAGLLRLINKSAKLHADFGPFDGPGWEIGKVASQITWNILLKQVEGGESIVYDRLWQGTTDDARYKEPSPGYGYSVQAVDGRASKILRYREGDLHFFNSRNFHEVRTLPNAAKDSRYTMSSFVGLLPPSAPSGPALVLWS